MPLNRAPVARNTQTRCIGAALEPDLIVEGELAHAKPLPRGRGLSPQASDSAAVTLCPRCAVVSAIPSKGRLDLGSEWLVQNPVRVSHPTRLYDEQETAQPCSSFEASGRGLV